MNRSQRLMISKEELDQILDQSVNTGLVSKGKEVLMWDKNSLINEINSKLSNVQINHEVMSEELNRYNSWRQEISIGNLKYDDL